MWTSFNSKNDLVLVGWYQFSEFIENAGSSGVYEHSNILKWIIILQPYTPLHTSPPLPSRHSISTPQIGSPWFWGPLQQLKMLAGLPSVVQKIIRPSDAGKRMLSWVEASGFPSFCSTIKSWFPWFVFGLQSQRIPFDTVYVSTLSALTKLGTSTARSRIRRLGSIEWPIIPQCWGVPGRC